MDPEDGWVVTTRGAGTNQREILDGLTEMLVVRCKYRREELSRVQRDGGYYECSAPPHTIQRASMALTVTNEKIA